MCASLVVALKAALGGKGLHLLAANSQAAEIDSAGDKQLGERSAPGCLCDRAVPFGNALIRVVILGVEDQDRHIRAFHVKLMDQPIVCLPSEVPEPYLALDSLR